MKSYRIDDVVGDTEKVLFFKIDVQGFELVRSSRSLLCHDHLIPPADLCAAACCRAYVQDVLKGAEKLIRDPAR